MDILPTIASFAEARPSDRIIDGVKISIFYWCQSKSKRDGFVVYVGEEIYGVKWRNWKMMTKDAGVGVKKLIQFLNFMTCIQTPKKCIQWMHAF